MVMNRLTVLPHTSDHGFGEGTLVHADNMSNYAVNSVTRQCVSKLFGLTKVIASGSKKQKLERSLT